MSSIISVIVDPVLDLKDWLVEFVMDTVKQPYRTAKQILEIRKDLQLFKKSQSDFDMYSDYGNHEGYVDELEEELLY